MRFNRDGIKLWEKWREIYHKENDKLGFTYGELKRELMSFFEEVEQ